MYHEYVLLIFDINRGEIWVKYKVSIIDIVGRGIGIRFMRYVIFLEQINIKYMVY